MGKINSRQKGARAEREVAKILTEKGFEARRGQQFSGSPDSPDVICAALDGFHLEVKHVEKLNIHDAIAQAERDSRADQIPTVVHRKNKTKWLVTLSLDNFLTLVENESDDTRN